MSASEYISAALNNNHISPVYYQTLSKAQRSWELSLTWFWLVEVPWKCRNCCRKLTLGRKGPQLLGAPNGASNSVSLPLCFSLSQYHEICTHIGRYTDCTIHCTMVPLSTRSCLKSNKLRPILNGHIYHAIFKNIGLYLFGSKQPREKLV